MRLACVHVPQLALQAALRRAPEAREQPAALLAVVPTSSGSKGKGAPRVIEMNADARRAGVRPGMTGAQASAAAPGLRLLRATEADREAGAAALADVGFAFAPRVERDGERIYFAVDDLGRLYPRENDQTGTPGGFPNPPATTPLGKVQLHQRALAQAIQAHAARIGFGARVAIASTRGTARVAARAHELAVVPPDRAEARAFLAPLPVTLFTDDDELRAAFRRWGTRTAGAIAALPPQAVALRLGPDGAAVARLARADDEEPFLPLPPPDALEEAADLEYPIAELDPLSFVLRGLVDRALERLAGRSLACAELTLRLTLDPRGLDVRTIPIAAPTREAKPLIELARLDLARRPPEAPVIGLHVIALPARVRATQLDMLRPTGPAPNRLAVTLARLAALVGPENVGAPAAVDSWREEAIALAPYPPRDAGPAGAAAGDLTLSLRRRRPPEEVEVLMGREGPTALRGAETTARVLIAAGPYRLSGEWWKDDGGGGGWAREYWDVHASDGAVYRLHRDARDGRFYLDGYYD